MAITFAREGLRKFQPAEHSRLMLSGIKEYVVCVAGTEIAGDGRETNRARPRPTP